MTKQVPLLIIGAGPYGLAMAAYAGHRRLDYVICGHPMDFWKSNMPRGMLLRSSWDWHIDPLGAHTLQAYANAHNVNTGGAEPIPRPLPTLRRVVPAREGRSGASHSRASPRACPRRICGDAGQPGDDHRQTRARRAGLPVFQADPRRTREHASTAPVLPFLRSRALRAPGGEAMPDHRRPAKCL